MKASDTVMSDAQIRQAITQAMADAEDYGDDGNPIPERNVAREQAAVSFKAGKKVVVEWINENWNRWSDSRWQSILKEWGLGDEQ